MTKQERQAERLYAWVKENHQDCASVSPFDGPMDSGEASVLTRIITKIRFAGIASSAEDGRELVPKIRAAVRRLRIEGEC